MNINHSLKSLSVNELMGRWVKYFKGFKFNDMRIFIKNSFTHILIYSYTNKIGG